MTLQSWLLQFFIFIVKDFISLNFYVQHHDLNSYSVLLLCTFSSFLMSPFNKVEFFCVVSCWSGHLKGDSVAWLLQKLLWTAGIILDKSSTLKVLTCYVVCFCSVVIGQLSIGFHKATLKARAAICSLFLVSLFFLDPVCSEFTRD